MLFTGSCRRRASSMYRAGWYTCGYLLERQFAGDCDTAAVPIRRCGGALTGTAAIKMFLAVTVLSLWSGLTFPVVFAGELKRDLLGVHFAMTKDEVRGRLEQIGTIVRDERKRHEIWQVRDNTFSHVIVGFDKDEDLRFVTAVARADAEAHRIRYCEVADLQAARQAGDPLVNNFNYEWDLHSNHQHPRTLVIARGRDANFLETYSLKKLDERVDVDGETSSSARSATRDD